MKITVVFLLLLVSLATNTNAQFDKKLMDSLNRLSEQDHKKMMTLLGITSIRPGANGWDTNAPNAANYDEAKANPFPILPDPLISNDGTKILNSTDWWKLRRPEIVEWFDKEIIGRVPAHIPQVHWEVKEVEEAMIGGVPVVTKHLIGRVDNHFYKLLEVNLELSVTIPAKATKPVPMMLELAWKFPSGFRPPASTSTEPSWKEQIISRGWGFAQLYPTSYQADHGAGLTQGIIGLCNKGQLRKADDWGALRAWAWGASKAMDYFETDKTIDVTRVGVEGHSRYGKAALITVAYDSRFAIGYISSSGEGGAKPHRRNYGETVENLAGSGEYHWMAGNFIKYAGPLQWSDLPVDAHELIALCAPRPVFVGCGNVGENWVDPRGMFMATVAAGPVYQLLGKKALESSSFPAVEALVKGDLAFRQHAGGHTPGPNWETFLNFAATYFNR